VIDNNNSDSKEGAMMLVIIVKVKMRKKTISLNFSNTIIYGLTITTSSFFHNMQRSEIKLYYLASVYMLKIANKP